MGPKHYANVPENLVWDEGITIGEAAKLAGVTAVCIMQWISQGRDSAGKIPHGYRLIGTRPDRTRLYEIVLSRKDVLAWKRRIAKSGRPSRLSKDDIRNIRDLKRNGRTLKEIGNMFGISDSYVSLIARGLRG